MTFIIHAWKAERNVMTVRIGPAVAVDKARELEKMGLGSLHHRRSWQSIYDQLLLIAQDSVALCPDRAAPLISSSLLSHTEAGALGVPPSVISSVQDLARPLADVLNRGGKGWRGYALAVPFQACFPSKPAWSRGRLIVWSGPPDSISLELGRDALLGYHGDSPPRDGTGLIFSN